MNRHSATLFEERWLLRTFWTQRVAFRHPCEKPCSLCRALLVVLAAQQASKRFASGSLLESLPESKSKLLVWGVLEVVSSRPVALISPWSHSAVSSAVSAAAPP